LDGLNEFAEGERLNVLNGLNDLNNGQTRMQKKGIVRMPKLALKSDGFTLIEVVLIIVMVSIFMASIMLPFISSVRESDLPEITTIAYFLAQEELETLTIIEYDSLDSQDTGGTARAVSGYADYTREVEVANVDEDFNPSASDVGYKQITVKVFHSKFPDGISAETLRTNF
jgi:type II secretory pathway pseudopilin PulG